jgi:formamidopyrimidine-DNA glycosylase
MPELPEVETIRRGLASTLPGRKIVQVDVLRADSIACPSAKLFAKKLLGHRFEEIERRAKYILCRLDREAGLAIHLRMSGRILLVKKKKADKHLRVRIGLDNGQELHFEDMRVFGRLWYVEPGHTFEEVITALSLLGPEPDQITKQSDFHKTLAKRNQAIKTALLDQHLVSGIGNIYADESLYLARIHPMTKAKDLSPKQVKVLVDKSKLVLAKAIELGGSSLRDYRSSDGVNGQYQGQSLVYGRIGEPCTSCKTAIERVKIAGRSSHFCPRCQILKPVHPSIQK